MATLPRGEEIRAPTATVHLLCVFFDANWFLPLPKTNAHPKSSEAGKLLYINPGNIWEMKLDRAKVEVFAKNNTLL